MSEPVVTGAPPAELQGGPAGETTLPAPASAGESAPRAWAKYALGIALVGVLTLWLSGDAYWTNLLTTGLLFAGLASAWNIVGGYGGQFSLGHAVFFGIGAYAVALLQVERGWSPWLALVAGALLAAVIAALLAWPLFRLRGPFFAIGTLALSEVALALANYFEWTGGPRGVRIPFGELAVTNPSTWLWIMFAYMAAVVAVSLFILRNRLGYYLIAVRDGEDAAAAAGANPLFVKSLALVISATLTAAGGGLFIMFIGFLDPDSVLSILNVGVRLPLLALIGGVGTVAGPVIGALILQPGEAYATGELANLPPGVSQMVIGALLVLAALFFKRGIWGAGTQLARRVRGRR
jgi:branched-chain amino acid transport system permease protein